MKIAVVVHGRWDAFDVTRELARRGHQVTLFTNYPRRAVVPYGVDANRIRSFWPHGVLSRAVGRLTRGPRAHHAEAQLHTLFGRWAARAVRTEPWDVAYVFSGVAEETFRALDNRPTLRMLVRESAHVRVQERLLRDEENRTGAALHRPSAWMINREEREYALADSIRVLSSFNEETFVAEGVLPQKVKLVVSGVQTDAFRARQADIDQRCQRLLSGSPLRVLNVGTFSYQKGAFDIAAMMTELGTERFEYRFVGAIAAEATRLAAQLRPMATFSPPMPQAQLPSAYGWGDLFNLPTIHDGFPAVLAQAAAAGLPIVTTPNGAGLDLVRDGQSGWVIPIRSPRLLVERLAWADGHRAEVAAMVRNIYADFQPRDFAEVAADLERVCADCLGTRVAIC